MTALMILAIFWPALAGLAVWFLPAAKEDRGLRARLNCGALAIELAMVIALCTAQGQEATSSIRALYTHTEGCFVIREGIIATASANSTTAGV